MKFKVSRNSETGKKLAPIEERAIEAFEAQRKIAIELGFQGWQRGAFVAFGGIGSLIPKKGEKPDSKLWKKQWDGYYPKANSKEGKRLIKLLEELPTVEISELNMAVGFNEQYFKTIGISFIHKEFYVFSVGDDWEFEPPSDCIEITVSEYKRLSE